MAGNCRGVDFWLNGGDLVSWILLNEDRALCLPNVGSGQKIVLLREGDKLFDFQPWSLACFALRHESLFKRRWVHVWGLPLNLWTLEVFNAIGKTCGGLSSVDQRTLDCEELRWARLEVVESDLRGIPRLISVVDRGKLYPVAVMIEGEISMVKSICPKEGGGLVQGEFTAGGGWRQARLKIPCSPIGMGFVFQFKFKVGVKFQIVGNN